MSISRGIGAIAAQARKIAVELLGGVRAEIARLQLGRGEVRRKPPDILGAVIDRPEGSPGEGRIAAAGVARGALENQHARAAFGRGDGGAQGSIACPHDHD